jgi:predicted RecA/RadA family phage recombinase
MADGNANGLSAMEERSTMRVPLTVAVEDGHVSLIGTLWTYVFGSQEPQIAGSLEEGTDEYTAVYKDPRVLMDKEDALAIDQGDKVYWDDTAKKITKTASLNYNFGWCVQDAAAADAQVLIDFTGVNAVAEA